MTETKQRETPTEAAERNIGYAITNLNDAHRELGFCGSSDRALTLAEDAEANCKRVVQHLRQGAREVNH